MQKVSLFLSGLLSPLLAPSYGIFLALWTSTICYQALGTRLAVLLVIFGITCLLPLIAVGILHNLKIIEDHNLINSKDRIYPYIITILCYIAATIYLINVHAPGWLVAFMGGGTLAIIISFVINFKWKISAHGAGLGALVALLFFIHTSGLEAFNLFGIICIAIILSGLVGTARLHLKRHNFWQVFAGFFNGYLCINLIMTLFG